MTQAFPYCSFGDSRKLAQPRKLKLALAVGAAILSGLTFTANAQSTDVSGSSVATVTLDSETLTTVISSVTTSRLNTLPEESRRRIAAESMEVDQMIARIKEMIQARYTAETINTETLRTIEQLRDQIADLDRRLTRQKVDSSFDLADRNEEIARLRKQLSDGAAAIAALSGARDRLQSQVGDWKFKHRSGDRQLSKLREEFAHSNAELEQLGNHNARLARQLSLANQARGQAIDELQHTRDRLESANGKLKTTSAQLSGTRDELGSARNDLNNVRDELGTARNDLNNIRDELGTVREELNALAQQRDTAQAERDQILADSERIRDGLTRELESAKLANITIQQTRADASVPIRLGNADFFAQGSATLTAEGASKLTKLAQIIATFEDRRIVVEGHTDNVPIGARLKSVYQSNWELSVARAAAAVRYIQSQSDIDPQLLTASGFGEYKPMASNETAQGRQMNRRVEVVLYPKVNQQRMYSELDN